MDVATGLDLQADDVNDDAFFEPMIKAPPPHGDCGCDCGCVCDVCLRGSDD